MAEITNAQLDMLTQELKKRLGLIKYFATLGDSDDLSSSVVDEPGRPGYVRVRLENDDVPYRTVKCGLLGAYSPYPGSPVIVGYDEKGDLAIEKADFDAIVEANGNPLVYNSGDNRLTSFNQTDGLLPLSCGAVSSAEGTLTNEVYVNSFRFVDKTNTVQWFEGALVDLTALVPGANLHRYVALFLKDDLTIEAIGSTPIATITPLTESDKQECFDTREVLSIPIALWRLHDAQTVVTNSDKVEDLRPWIKSPGVDAITGHMSVPGVDIIVDITDSNPTEVFDDGTTSAGDGWSAGELNHVTFPTGGDEHYLTITKPGKYRIDWDMSFQMAAPGANIEVHGGIMIDDVAVRNDGEAHRTIANNSDTGLMASHALIDCPNGNEEISLWVLNAQNTNNITVEHGNVVAELKFGS